MENNFDKRVTESRFTSFGATFMGPLLSFFAGNLVSHGPKEQTLFFLAREGYWLEKAYQHHLDGAQLQRNSAYLLASRAFLFKLLLDDPRSYSYSLKGRFSGALYDLLRTRFLLSDCEIKQLFDVQLLQELTYLPEDKTKVVTLLTEKRDVIAQIIGNTKAAYLAYLESLGLMDVKELHLVDLGYSGTIQALLGLLLNKPTCGHYLIASNPGESNIAGLNVSMKGYLKEGVKLGKGYIPLDRSMFLESMLTAPFGQFRDIRRNILSGSFDFYFGRKVSAQRHFYELEQVMAGALAYTYHAASHGLAFTQSEVEALIIQYVTKVNMIPKSVSHLFDIDDDVAGNGTVNALNFFGLRQ